MMCSGRQPFGTLALCLLITLFLTGAVQEAVAVEYYVSVDGSDTMGEGTAESPWRTIQYAVNQVLENGATIRVMPGTYEESVTVNLIAAGLRLLGSGADVTTVDASEVAGNGGVIRLSGGQGYVISGFTLTGGTYEGFGSPGGAIRGLDADGWQASSVTARVQNNVIMDNSGWGYRYAGGAITLGPDCVIRNNSFINNHARYLCGAVYVGARSLIEGNVFLGNSGGTDSAGAVESYDESTIIRHNVFSGNWSGWDDTGQGGAIRGAATIHNNVFEDNSAAGYNVGYGGAAYLTAGTFTNNTLVGNIGDPRGAASGIYVAVPEFLDDLPSGPVTIANNIIVNGTGGVGLYVEAGATVTSDYSNIWSNDLGSYGGSAIPGPHDIHVDPYFAGSGDYHLKSRMGRWDPGSGAWVTDAVTSPCIATGDPDTDFSNEPHPNGGRVNMGAWGNTAEASKSDIPLYITERPAGDPNPVVSGEQVQCSVTAVSAEGYDLLYEWTAEDGAGNFDDPTAQNPRWTAPANTTGAVQEYEITVTATCAEDDTITATASYTQQVEPVHEITITEAPTGNPNPVVSGGSVLCSVTAVDSLGHDLLYEWTAEDGAGNFDDPTAQNPTWTASINDTGVVQEYRITVMMSCIYDAAVSATASYTQQVVPGVAHTFPAGIQMVSVPLIPANPDPAQLGFDDGRWARWNPSTGEYVFRDDDPDAYTSFADPERVPGRGYWARFAAATEVNVAGEPLSEDAYSMQLPAGWSQIGNPRLTEVPWSILGEGALRVRHNGAEMTLAEAQAAGVCEDFAWAYRDGLDYQLVYDPSVVAVGEHDRLNAWEGYWFLAHQPVELVFPSVAELASATPRPAAKRAEGDWSIPFIASIDGASTAQVVVGQSTTPRQMQLPPSFGTGVQLSVLRDSQRLGVDLQERGDGPVWTLQAVSGVAGAQVTLQWPDLSEVPHEYRPMLVDITTGKRTYMRTSRGYSFTAGEAGEARRFEVQMAPAGVGALVTTASASVASGGNVELRLALSAAGTVDAEVMNIAGRQVGTICRGREMNAGAETLLWDAMSDRGTRLPGGMYLIRVTARTDDGQQTSALAPLQLGR